MLHGWVNGYFVATWDNIWWHFIGHLQRKIKLDSYLNRLTSTWMIKGECNVFVCTSVVISHQGMLGLRKGLGIFMRKNLWPGKSITL